MFLKIFGVKISYSNNEASSSNKLGVDDELGTITSYRTIDAGNVLKE